MTLALWPSLFIVFLQVSTLAAYRVDASCQNGPKPDQRDHDLIREAAIEAFNMADAALFALDRPSKDANVLRLIELLYCLPHETADKKDMTIVINNLRGIKNMNVENTDDRNNFATNQNEVIIYCNIDRVEKRDDGLYYDSAICKTRYDFPAGFVNLAFTWVPKVVEQVEGGPPEVRTLDYPGQITVCPWFLDWARHKKFKTWLDFAPHLVQHSKASLASFAMTIGKMGWPLTQVDAWCLLDKVLLHEFAHTVAGGQAIDVPMPGWFLQKAYGWRAVTALAKDASRLPAHRPQSNAETLALFGVGIRMLNIRPRSLYITMDGKITNDPPINAQRRSFPRELQHPHTPVAFERFLAMLNATRSPGDSMSE